MVALHMDRDSKDTRFVYVSTLVFFVLTLFNILHHEMWRDEFEFWMRARDANSLLDLIKNMRYTGHPMLWSLILYPITGVTRNPLAMQMAHLLVATFSAFIFLRFAPFNKLLRGLFIFGYFPFFEYATISRNYAVGILFLFIFCAYFGKDFKKRSYILLSVILFLMCQCNAFSAILAIALGIAIFLEPALLKNFTVYRSGRFYASILIFTAGLAISIIQMIPPADSVFYHPNTTARIILIGIAASISHLWDAFIPIPRIEPTFWNTNILTYLPVQRDMISALSLIASLGLFLCSLCIVVRKKIPAVYYILGVVGVTAFCSIFYEGFLRHKAHYYFAFVTAMWIGSYYPTKEFEIPSVDRFFGFFEKNKSYFMTVVFSIGVVSASIANTLDYTYPFSASKEAADYIKQNNLQNMAIAGHVDYAAEAVSGYLDKPLYYPAENRIGSFELWTNNRRNMNVAKALEVIRHFSDTVKDDVLLVLNDPPPHFKIRQYGLVPVKSFPTCTVRDECFFLYVMKYERKGIQ